MWADVSAQHSVCFINTVHKETKATLTYQRLMMNEVALQANILILTKIIQTRGPILLTYTRLVNDTILNCLSNYSLLMQHVILIFCGFWILLVLIRRELDYARKVFISVSQK